MKVENIKFSFKSFCHRHDPNKGRVEVTLSAEIDDVFWETVTENHTGIYGVDLDSAAVKAIGNLVKRLNPYL